MTNGRRHHAALPSGYKLHWYEIESILGQGGFGITYLATDTNLESPVAIKEFLPTDLAVRTRDSSVQPISGKHADTFGWGLERFIAEAKTLARFNHPNIVRVFTVFEANATAYMVMERVDGESLEDAIKFGRVASEAALVRILLPLMAGLEEVHGAGFIHRDIKPENIYLRRNGSPVLLDFGSARQAVGGRTRALTALVSPGYAPYEQYDSTREADKQGPWTDIYALGATAYRAIAGRGPPDAMARMNAVLDGKDVLVSAVELGGGCYSPAFLAAVDRALAFRPEHRPQGIREWRRQFADGLDPAPDWGAVEIATQPDDSAAAPETVPPDPAVEDTVLGPPAVDDSAPTEVRGALRRPTSSGPRTRLIAVAGVALLSTAGAWVMLRDGPHTAPEPAPTMHAPAVPRPVAEPSPAPSVGVEEEAVRASERETAERQGAEAERDAAERQLEQERAAKALEAERRARAQAERERRTEEEQARAQRRERIAELLTAAVRDVSALRLSTPPGSNALEKYRAVLALEPDHPQASAGLANLVERYVELASRAEARAEFASAEQFLARAEEVSPGDRLVGQVRERLASAKARHEAGLAAKAQADTRGEEALAARAEREAAAAAAARMETSPRALETPAARAAEQEPAASPREPAIAGADAPRFDGEVREAFESYSRSPPPKAFVIALDEAGAVRAFASSWGWRSITQVRAKAMSTCRLRALEQGLRCQLYSVDDRVVWGAD